MLNTTFELINLAASSSLLVFCLCNLIIVILLVGSSRSSSFFLVQPPIVATSNKNAGIMTDSHTVDKRTVVTGAREAYGVKKALIHSNIHDQRKGDEEEEDDELRERVEEFIDKVNRGWKAEKLRTYPLVKRKKMDATTQLQSSKNRKFDSDADDNTISKFPDCVLHYILSFLPMKDTIRTSVLSTRWRYIWTTSISDIDLDDSFSGNSVSRKYFLDFVERVLLLHDASDIRRFRLAFNVPVRASRVNSWVFAAVKHNLQELDLSLPVRASFVLPCCPFTGESLVVLVIEMDCALKVPTSVCLPSLKRLQIADGNLQWQNTKSCPVLEELPTQRLFSSCPLFMSSKAYNSAIYAIRGTFSDRATGIEAKNLCGKEHELNSLLLGKQRLRPLMILVLAASTEASKKDFVVKGFASLQFWCLWQEMNNRDS
ncbi:hypothetical protein RJ639_018101 [Escallonia herrerae]|uniref:F-box domain-containing protein n=1 Tax=Escallonia herrerae TaxID=1293975 RepID=A0AA89AI99_9ASTE|nr:hypothetical protein RJ639_018101 [Escallonia herrerae]